MPENTQSAFAAAVGRLGELSESELRQLYLIIGVRLGFPDGTKPAATGKSSAATSTSKGGKPSRKKSKGAPVAKGNPQRKSQWANHPLYQEYARLKKTVETQAKESKLSFNAVRTDEARQYREVLSQWLETKSRFRGRQTAEDDSSDEESETEEQPKLSSAKGKGKQFPFPPTGKSGASWASDTESAAAVPAKPGAAVAAYEKAGSVPAKTGTKPASSPPAKQVGKPGIVPGGSPKSA